MSNPEINFVKSSSIDREKWDQCIENSPNGMAYAYSWFLDRICPRWDALIWGEYLYVMPLVNNTKFGISYIYQPFFTQQLGVFSTFLPEPEIVNQFLHAIPHQFRLTDMRLNEKNVPTAPNYLVTPNVTYLLPLQNDFETIRRNYNDNTRRNIKKAVQNKVFISPVHDVLHFIEFTQTNLRKKSPEIKTRHYLALQKVINYALFNQHGEIYGAWDSSNKLIAACFFLNTNKRCIYLAASSNAQGIESSAMFLLVDTFIRNKAAKNLILDFEGSNRQGISRFYAGFGALPETYYSIHQNRLPKFLRILKK